MSNHLVLPLAVSFLPPAAKIEADSLKAGISGVIDRLSETRNTYQAGLHACPIIWCFSGLFLSCPLQLRLRPIVSRQASPMSSISSSRQRQHLLQSSIPRQRQHLLQSSIPRQRQHLLQSSIPRQRQNHAGSILSSVQWKVQCDDGTLAWDIHVDSSAEARSGSPLSQPGEVEGRLAECFFAARSTRPLW